MPPRSLKMPVALMARTLLKLSKGGSQSALLAMLRAGRALIDDEGYRQGLAFVERRVREKHGAVGAVKRIATELNPKARDTIVNNFVVGQVFGGYRRRYAFWEKHGFNAPAALVISPTMRCNLDCTGCYSGKIQHPEDLPIEEIERLVTEAEGMGTNIIVFTGGEPLCRPDILDVCERHPDVAFQVYTNGTLVTERLADRLKDLGNVALAISVDGNEEDTDLRRGKGTWVKILRAMRLLKERGVLFAFSATVIPASLDHLTSDAFAEEMVARGCILGWYFQYMPVGAEPDPERMLSPEERTRLRDGVVRLRTKHPIFLVDFWNDGELLLGCMSGGRRYLHVNATGDVEPCVFAQFAVDNIEGKTIADILKTPFMRAIRDKLPLSENYLRPCMIIDHPQVLREIVATHGARPTRPGADSIITSFADQLDAYAKEYGEIADRKWKRTESGVCSFR